MARQAATVGAIGFSHNTCMPAAAAARAMRWCADGAATMSTTSSSGTAAAAASRGSERRRPAPQQLLRLGGHELGALRLGVDHRGQLHTPGFRLAKHPVTAQVAASHASAPGQRHAM